MLQIPGSPRQLPIAGESAGTTPARLLIQYRLFWLAFGKQRRTPLNQPAGMPLPVPA